MRLTTIPFSHYNERARWALCHHGVAVEERRVLPGLHLAAVRWTTRPEHRRADATSSPLSTPVLVAGGEVLPSSSEIIGWLEARSGDEARALRPEAHASAIESIEDRAHDVLGPATRTIAYYHLSRNLDAFRDVVRGNVGLGQRAFFRVFGARIVGHVRSRFGDAKRASAEATLRDEIAWLDERLGGRAYYVADRFTAADLTVACMLAPVIAPVPEYGAHLPTLGASWAALSEEIRDTAVGRHALSMFAEHRPVAPPGWSLR